jgi:hypothetical protein
VRRRAPVRAPFERAAEAPSRAAAPFPRWFRAAGARGVALRCVFERSAVYTARVQALRLENLDGGVLGPHYREDALVVEDTADHFALLEPARIARHLDALLTALG